jgi:lysozyme family protein
MQSNFENALDLVLKEEGGFETQITDAGNHLPDGRAGSTNLGVTQANWESYVGHPVTWNDMKALTREKVMPFYKRKYWDIVQGDFLPDGVDYMAFDFAVNAGPGRAIKLLQEAVGTTPDGELGHATISAIHAMPVKEVIELYTAAKEKFYKELNNPTYERGWLSRVARVEITALKMVA